MSKMMIDLSRRPVISVVEASMLLGLSTQSIKRKITDGKFRVVHRDNKREKLLIYTESIKEFLYKKGV